jgi:hypothetical protein
MTIEEIIETEKTNDVVVDRKAELKKKLDEANLDIDKLTIVELR